MLAAYSFDPRLMWDAAEQRTTSSSPGSRPAASLSRVAHSIGFGK
jgi:hypothetical protein